ncbi:hypothetical protein MMC30_003885 [Trapelia coarctata]|nr:hypothetical protein [Trapelia coarctata]
MADPRAPHDMPCGCRVLPCTLTGESPDPVFSDAVGELDASDSSSDSSNSSNSSSRTVVPADTQREPEFADDFEGEPDFDYLSRVFHERIRDSRGTDQDSDAQSSAPRAAGDRYSFERLETIDENRSSNIEIPRRRGKRHSKARGVMSNIAAGTSRPHLPRAVYRNGNLVEYDLAAGGSGPWSVEEEDTPAATFGGRANRSEERRQHHRDPSNEQPDRPAESPATNPETVRRARQGRRQNRNQTQNASFAGPSQAAQQQHWPQDDPQTRYINILRREAWRCIENRFWKFVLYGYVERGPYPWIYQGAHPSIYQDFHPPPAEILDIIGHYFMLAFARGGDGFRIPDSVWRELGFRAVLRDRRSPRSPF